VRSSFLQVIKAGFDRPQGSHPHTKSVFFVLRESCRFERESGWQGQIHLLRWQRLGAILAKEYPSKLVDHAGLVIRPQYYTGFKEQSCIRQRLDHNAVNSESEGRRPRENCHSNVFRDQVNRLLGVEHVVGV
jgi:hypothetical protein